MYKKFLVLLVVIAAVFNMYYTSYKWRRNNYLSTLIDVIDTKMSTEGDNLIPIITPIVKKDRKDPNQFDILTMYTNGDGDIISNVLIIPDGIEEPFTMSLITFNVSATEDLFLDKLAKHPLPKVLNNHKLMKPCRGEVEIPVLKEVGFKVESLDSVEFSDNKYNYHNKGYCTKLLDSSDRYIEIDGKSSEQDKFKFEFNLQIMHLLHPDTYSSKSPLQTVIGWKYIEHVLVFLFIVTVLFSAYYFYFQRFKSQIIQKLHDDIELQNTTAATDDQDLDIDEFMIDDEEVDTEPTAPREHVEDTKKKTSNKKPNKKVSYKNADEEEVENLISK